MMDRIEDETVRILFFLQPSEDPPAGHGQEPSPEDEGGGELVAAARVHRYGPPVR